MSTFKSYICIYIYIYIYIYITKLQSKTSDLGLKRFQVFNVSRYKRFKVLSLNVTYKVIN